MKRKMVSGEDYLKQFRTPEREDLPEREDKPATALDGGIVGHTWSYVGSGTSSNTVFVDLGDTSDTSDIKTSTTRTLYFNGSSDRFIFTDTIDLVS